MGRSVTRDKPQFQDAHEESAGFAQYQPPVDPVYPEDSPEDIIADLISPTVLPKDILSKLAGLISSEDRGQRNGEQGDSAKRLRAVLVKLAPPRHGIIEWYSLHFALGSEHTDRLTPGDFARIMGVSRVYIYRYITRWRAVLGLRLDPMQKSQRLCVAKNRGKIRDPKTHKRV